ncbi:sigma-70 family RNA polymerase sigma factor [Pseudoflavitalea sp. X16]|uniref:RNA polymerase sigma factor n=1 Tax=Paraflavitalea devenefica TaxID=2716334 RepID=UPI0014212B9A|nr:sigma-70 family RNA polymerase sigma factor [Paraflavitalea devenefica]NII23561.1 sigma-70 family RNA polymerase sigma factor [Paraflavitalea devenefica]
MIVNNLSRGDLHRNGLLPPNTKTDQSVFDELFHTYYSRIYGKALQLCKVHATAQDVAQQVFLKLWEKRADLAHIPNPEAWLFSVANHQIVDIFRNQLMQDKYTQFALHLLEQEASSPEDLLITRQQKQLMEKSLELLSPKQKEVYRLNRNEGMTYVEIATKLGISRDTVKEYMGIAIAKIKKFLREQQAEWLLLPAIVQLFF